MGDNRRVKRRKTGSNGSNSMHSSSADIVSPTPNKRDVVSGKEGSFRRLRKRDPSDMNSSSREEERLGTDSGQTSDPEPEPSSASRLGKRKRGDQHVYVKNRSQVRTTEPFKFFHRLTSDLYDHEDAEEFQMPVLEKYDSDDVPNYEDIVSNPMDLGTVRENLDSDAYVGKSDDNSFYFDESKCLSDLRLVYNNCKEYNVENSSLYKAADVFLKLIDTRLQRRSAHAQRTAKALQARRAKSRKESERLRRNPAEAKAQTTSNRGNKASAGIEIVRQQLTSDSEQCQNENDERMETELNTQLEGKRKSAQNRLSQIENEESPAFESVLHVSHSNKSGPGVSANLPQNTLSMPNVPTTMALQGSAQLLQTQGPPQAVPPNVLQTLAQDAASRVLQGSVSAGQSQDQLLSYPHSAPQGQGFVVNQHSSPMMQPTFAGARGSSPLPVTTSINVPTFPGGSGTSVAAPGTMKQVTSNNLTGLVQSNGSQFITPGVLAVPGMPSVSGVYGLPVVGTSTLTAPYMANGNVASSMIAAPGSNAMVTSGLVPVEAEQDEGEVNEEDEDSDDDDGKANSSGASSVEDEDIDEDDLDQQGGDISFTFIGTEGMEKKRGRKSVRVIELEGQHDSLMKRRRVMMELSVELEKRRQLEMPYLEKKKLCEEAAALDYVRMKGVVDILARGMGRPDLLNEVEIDLDIDYVDNSVLREIQYFLKNPAAMTAKESVRQVETQISEIEQELVDLRYQKASSSARE